MDDLIKKILNIPEETQTLEIKRLEGEKLVTKVIETIVAMTNTDGGTIIFGVDDPEKTKLSGLDRIYGIEENIELFDTIGREVQKISPPIGHLWNPEIIEISEIGKKIALLNIPKSISGFHSINNQVYLRQMKSNKRLTPQEIVKMNYAKGFEKADKELVNVDFELLNTQYFHDWRDKRGLPFIDIQDILFSTGLARKNNEGLLQPTRAAVMLFALFPTNIMETKCAIRIFQYQGTVETFQETPNYIGAPRTIDGPIIKMIKDAHEYVLSLLRSGIRIQSGFITKYQIPERVIKEAITNAVIHRDYNIKRDIEVKIFEDRVEITSPGLFPYNITKTNIGRVRSDGYRNDLLVKHLREFPNPPNLDQNEGVKAMRNEMESNNLFAPLYITYPFYQDAVEVVLWNEQQPGEWEKVRKYLEEHIYITNLEARKATGIVQVHTMSRLLKKWTQQGLITKIESSESTRKFTKYKLTIALDFQK